MKHRKYLKEQEIKMFKYEYKYVAISFILLGLIGLLDSSYLVYEHYNQAPSLCLIGDDCDSVLTSEYSSFLGIPTALFGVLYYLFICIFSVLYLIKKNRNILKYLSYTTIVGFLASLYFVYLQFFIIEAICEYCMLSAVSSTFLFIGGMIFLWKNKEKIELSE